MRNFQRLIMFYLHSHSETLTFMVPRGWILMNLVFSPIFLQRHRQASWALWTVAANTVNISPTQHQLVTTAIVSMLLLHNVNMTVNSVSVMMKEGCCICFLTRMITPCEFFFFFYLSYTCLHFTPMWGECEIHLLLVVVISLLTVEIMSCMLSSCCSSPHQPFTHGKTANNK